MNLNLFSCPAAASDEMWMRSVEIQLNHKFQFNFTRKELLFYSISIFISLSHSLFLHSPKHKLNSTKNRPSNQPPVTMLWCSLCWFSLYSVSSTRQLRCCVSMRRRRPPPAHSSENSIVCKSKPQKYVSEEMTWCFLMESWLRCSHEFIYTVGYTLHTRLPQTMNGKTIFFSLFFGKKTLKYFLCSF